MPETIPQEEIYINPTDVNCVTWAIRFFLGRNPLNQDEIVCHSGHFSFVSVRTAFCQTAEFKRFFLSTINPDKAIATAHPDSILNIALDHECIKWAIRFFLGRNPNDQQEIELHLGYTNFNELRTFFCHNREFRQFYAWANPDTPLEILAAPSITATQADQPIAVAARHSSLSAAEYKPATATGIIQVSNVYMQYHTRQGVNTVLNGINLSIKPGEKVGILGANGAGKSTLIRLISGAERPTSGTITRTMSVSWPLAFGGAFQGSLTGLDNLRFICRVYGVTIADKIPYVQEFSELGKYLREPVKTYSSGMLARLAFAISMVIEFDCYLIDEVISVGDARFTVKCQHELFEKRRDRAMIMVSHQPYNIREHCTRACVIKNGILHDFSNIDEAYEYYQATA